MNKFQIQQALDMMTDDEKIVEFNYDYTRFRMYCELSFETYDYKEKRHYNYVICDNEVTRIPRPE